MDRVVKELINRIILDGFPYVKLHTLLFINIIKEKVDKVISDEQHNVISRIFGFLILSYANGVWSNLNNVRFRRKLMEESYTRVIYHIVLDESLYFDRELEIYGKRFESDLQVNVEIFKTYRNKFLNGLQAKIEEGYSCDANSALFIILEWLQEALELSDRDMMTIAPHFSQNKMVIDAMGEIEKIALKVIIAERNDFKGVII